MTRHILAWAVAAALVWSPLAALAQEQEQKEPAGPPKIQMAILLDTSGSMEGLIHQARTQIWKVVNEFATAERNGQRPEFEVALYEYGKSSIPQKENYIRQIVAFTNDLDKVSEELFKLKTNGGDEYCGAVIERAVKELAWSQDNRDLKCIFIAGNEPFTQGGVNYVESCQASIAKGVTVNTIFCGPVSEGVATKWQHGAQLADGSYMSIDQNQVLPAIAAPQDKKLNELNVALNKTYIAYGDAKNRKEAAARQLQQDANAAGAAPAALAARATFKASGLYNNARWDLVDGVKNGVVRLKDLKAEELPESLRKLSPKELQEYVETQRQKRAQLQAEIKQLSDARDAYVAEKLKAMRGDAENTLDKALIEAARGQAIEKAFEFKE